MGQARGWPDDCYSMFARRGSVGFKVAPFGSPESEDFSFQDDMDKTSAFGGFGHEMKKPEKNEDEIVWGEDHVEVKIEQGNSPEGRKKTKRRKRKGSKSDGAKMHVENTYEDIGNKHMEDRSTDVGFGGQSKKISEFEMKQIELKLRGALFDKNIHERKNTNYKKAFQEEESTHHQDKVANFAGHNGPSGTSVVAPKLPVGNMLISHEQLKTMKTTLKRAYMAKIKEIKAKAEKFKEKMYEKEKLIEELRDEKEKLRYEKEHLSRTQGAMGIENLRQLGNRNNPTENRFVSAAAKKREEQRKKMLQALDKDDDGGAHFVGAELHNARYEGRLGAIYLQYDKLMAKIERSLPLTKDLAQIEARYGSSVSAFFRFFRFIIFMYFILSFVNFALLSYHLYHHKIFSLTNGGNLWDVQSLQFALQRLDTKHKNAQNFTNFYNNSESERTPPPIPEERFRSFCSELGSCDIDRPVTILEDEPSVKGYVTYTLFIEKNSPPSKIDYLFAGNIPTILLPSSFNFFKEASRGEERFNNVDLSADAMFYTLNMVVCIGILIVVAIRKVSHEDRKYKVLMGMESGDDGSRVYSKLSLAIWDHNVTSNNDAWDLKEAVTDQFSQIVFQSEKEEEIAARTNKDRYKLYARRLVGVLINLAVMSAGWGVILGLTAFGRSIAINLGLETEEQQKMFVTVGVPSTVAGMNAAIPTIIWMIITKLEAWDDKKFETQLIILRIFLAKVMNIMIQLVTYLMVSDPYVFKRSDLLSLFGGRGYFDNYLNGKFQMPLADERQCRADNVSYALVNLLLVQFVSSKLISIFMALAKYGRYIGKGKKGKWKKEFSVPFAVINLVYFCTVAFVTFAFFPFTFMLVTFITYFDFKFMKFQLENFMYKPLVPFDAKSIGNFFTRLLLLSMIIGSTIIHLTLSNPYLPRVFDLKSEPSETEAFGSQFPEQNYRIDRFRYFTSGVSMNQIDTSYKVPALVEYPDAKWNASIPGYFSNAQSPESELKLCEGTVKESSLKCCGVTKDGFGVPCITVHEIWEAMKASRNKSVTITSDFSDFKRIFKFEATSSDPDKLVATADMACGPFIGSENGYSTLLKFIDQYGESMRTASNVIRDSGGNYVIAFWTVIFMLLLRSLFKENSLYSQTIVHSEKQHALKNQAMALLAKSNDLQRKLDLKKRQAAALTR